MKLDIKELARRESEQIEWKERVADFRNVVKTIVAFSNDYANLGGGYVVCGAVETKDEYGFASVKMTGLTAQSIKEIEGKVISACRNHVSPPVMPLVEQLPAQTPDRRILIFIVPATSDPHSYRSGNESAFWVRLSSNTIQARNGVLRELMVKKGAMETWDRRRNDNARIEDIDLLVLRDSLQAINLWDNGRSYDDILSPERRLHALVPSLTVNVPLTDEHKPRNFSLLLFGKQPTDFFPGAYVVFSVYPGEDRSSDVAERVTVVGSLISQAKKLIDLLSPQSATVFDKTSNRPNQHKYPQRALQEAVVNALVHRDYEMDQPVRITIFSDRIEINSPGGLHRTIDPDQFKQGKAPPFWRNQSLSWFFNMSQLAQSEGQGIPTILKSMKDEGCPDPQFQIGVDNLVCTLPANPRYKILDNLKNGK